MFFFFLLFKLVLFHAWDLITIRSTDYFMVVGCSTTFGIESMRVYCLTRVMATCANFRIRRIGFSCACVPDILPKWRFNRPQLQLQPW